MWPLPTNKGGVNPELAHVLECEGVLSRTTHPHLGGALQHYTKTGALRHVLGGFYSRADAADSFGVKIAAVRAAHPNAVFVRETAARMAWLPTLALDTVQVAASRRHPAPGFSFERRSIPSELVRWDGEHYLSSAALTVLDLVDTLGSSIITDALRRGVVTIDGLKRALAMTKGRPGNLQRAQLVERARDVPWSELEVDAHVRLRRAHFPGWVANHPVIIAGRLHFLDVAVPELKLGAEIDGWQFHRGFDSFVEDRAKWNRFALVGWTLLHFTASTIEDLVPQMQEAASRLRTP